MLLQLLQELLLLQLLGLGLGLGRGSSGSGRDSILVLMVEHQGQGDMGCNRGIRQGIKSNHKPLLLLLVPTVTVDLELDVGYPRSEADQRIPILGAVQLGQQMQDLWEKEQDIGQDLLFFLNMILSKYEKSESFSTYTTLSLLQLGGHTLGTAQASLGLFLPVIGGTLEDGREIQNVLCCHLLLGHDLVSLGKEQVLGQTSVVISLEHRSILLTDDRELHIDDGLDTKSVLDLGWNVLLKLLLENMGLHIQTVGGRGLGVAVCGR